MKVDKDKPVIIDWKFRDGKDHPEMRGSLHGGDVVLDGKVVKTDGVQEILQNGENGDDVLTCVVDEGEGLGEGESPDVPAQSLGEGANSSTQEQPTSGRELSVNERPVLYGPSGALKRVRYCGAKTRAGGYCKRPAQANGRCRVHGGNNKRGVASGTFKHGKYSKYLPIGMRETYERSLKDPDLISLGNELAVMDSRLLQLLGRLDKGESGRLWLVAGELYDQLTQALRAGSLNDVNKKMMALGEVLKKGGDEYGLWKEIGDAMDRRRNLAEAERRRLVDGQYMIDVEKAKTLIAALAASVRKHVTDNKALAAISEDFLRLTEGPTGRANKSD